jgi:hypothetical protein
MRTSILVLGGLLDRRIDRAGTRSGMTILLGRRPSSTADNDWTQGDRKRAGTRQRGVHTPDDVS